MDRKYTRIEEVVYEDGDKSIHLTYDGAEEWDLEVDLGSFILSYNYDIEVVKRKKLRDVYSIKDILECVKDYGYEIPEYLIGENYLLVCGDSVLTEKLDVYAVYDHLDFIRKRIGHHIDLEKVRDYIKVVDNNVYVDGKEAYVDGKIIEWWW